MFKQKQIRALEARIDALETALTRASLMGTNVGRALNNEARISLLEQRFNEAQTLGLPPARLRANE